MQRGILALTKPELALAIQYGQLARENLANLIPKFELAFRSPKFMSNIEVNREEIETLLDTLPRPEPGQNPDCTTLLRTSLAAFLTKK